MHRDNRAIFESCVVQCSAVQCVCVLLTGVGDPYGPCRAGPCTRTSTRSHSDVLALGKGKRKGKRKRKSTGKRRG